MSNNVRMAGRSGHATGMQTPVVRLVREDPRIGQHLQDRPRGDLPKRQHGQQPKAALRRHLRNSFIRRPSPAGIMVDAIPSAPSAISRQSAAKWPNVKEILCEMRCHLQKCLEHSGVPEESVSFSQPPSLALADSGRGQGVNTAGSSRCFLLQFKCPNQQMDGSGERPSFQVKVKHLRALKRCPPGSAFYVLPLLADQKRFATCPSSILDKTCMIDVHDIMPECDPQIIDIHIYINADKSAQAFVPYPRDLNARPLRDLCDPVASVPKIPVLGFPAAGGGHSDLRELEARYRHLLGEWERRYPDETTEFCPKRVKKMLCNWRSCNPAGTSCLGKDGIGGSEDLSRLLVMCVDYGSAGAGKGLPQPTCVPRCGEAPASEPPATS